MGRASSLRMSGFTINDAPPVPLYDASTAHPIERLNAALEGRYVVERVLGRGGMATVYLATDVRHGREVAIKVLLPELSASIGGDRFEREIRLAAKLQHPHILGLFDSGAAMGLLYYVMPFVKGESLRDRLEREGALPIEDALVIALEVADALGHAHGQGIIHRDIKPENIMLSGGHALVADFGIARAATDAGVQKLTQTGMALGTPVYMSPEQSGGEEVGPPADIYSLACVLYEMLAGEPPFTGKNAMVIMARHAMEQVPSIRIVRSAVPDEVEAAIYAGMGKVPADRPKTAAEFAEILGMPLGQTATLRVLTGPTGMRRVPSGSQMLITRNLGLPAELQVVVVPWWQRRAVLGAAALVLVTGIAGSWFALNGARPTVVDPTARRVAVRYFDSSKDTTLSSLADGLTEGLINSLSNASSITVISRSGVERFRDPGIPDDTVVKALRVGYIVRGELKRTGKDVKDVNVDVNLYDRSGVRLSGAAVTLAASSPFAMRDSLQKVVSALIKNQLHQDIQLKEERAGTSNQAAWLELQRAEQTRKGIASLLSKGDTVGVDKAFAATDSMLAYSEQLDPRWAEPVSRRASVAYQHSRSVGRDPAAIRKWVEVGIGHANRALALDPNSADAFESRGTMEYWSWLSNLEVDPAKKLALLKGAKADLDSATSKNPRQASAFATMATVWYQVPGGTNNDVYIAAQNAYAADEFLTNANLVMHRLFTAAYDLGLFDKADQHCKAFASRFPQDYRSKRCRLFLLTIPKAEGLDVAAARRLADSIVALRPPKDSLNERLNTNLLIAAAMARASKTAPGLADSARALAKSSIGDGQIDPNRDLTFYAAFVYAQLGDNAAAISMMKEYLAANPQRVSSMRDDPGWWFKNLAATPEWRRLVQQVQ
ncbi:MAG: serine/threonine-protein kinase [bacterium]